MPATFRSFPGSAGRGADVDVIVRLDRGEYRFALDFTDLATDPGPVPVEAELLVEWLTHSPAGPGSPAHER